jgi:hypothetical protein
MKHIPKLATDSLIWEVIGIGEIIQRDSSKPVNATFFFQSITDIKIRLESNNYKYLQLPIEEIRHLIPGSLWKNGKRISAHTYGGHWISLDTYNAKQISASRNYCPKDIVRHLELKKNKNTNTKARILPHISYIQLENTQTRILIPCSEIFRHYMAPTAHFAKFAISQEFPAWISRAFETQTISLPSGRKKLTENELTRTNLLLKSQNTVEAAHLPHKSLKLTHINNRSKSKKNNLLITTKIPDTKNTKLRVSGYSIDASDKHSDGMYTFVVEKIHDSAPLLS